MTLQYVERFFGLGRLVCLAADMMKRLGRVQTQQGFVIDDQNDLLRGDEGDHPHTTGSDSPCSIWFCSEIAWRP